MALGIAELIILSLIVDWMFRKIKVPGLVGMLLVGIILGPYVLGLLDKDLLEVSSDLRMIALIVILLRAGFELSKETLHKVGLRALLLSFVPALAEGASVVFLGHIFLGLSYMESAVLGSVLSAVSPAVVVPLMIKFIEERRGTKKGIPTLILAASSIDDVFVIVVYSVLIGIYTGQNVNIAGKIIGIPISIIAGIGIGLICGLILYWFFEKFNPRATKRLLIVLGISVLLVNFEHHVERFFPFAALLAIMALGFIILEKNQYMAHEISSKLAKLWVFAEIILFTLVGAQVNIHVAIKAGLVGSLLIFLALIARSLATYLCLIKSPFTFSERIFVVISYIPKATVQAAIGGSPLIAMKMAGMNTQPGEIILAVAVLSILLTAPLGAWAITLVGRRVLEVEPLFASSVPQQKEKQKEKDMTVDFYVKDCMKTDILLLREHDNLKKVLHYFAENDYLSYPVVDGSNRLKGVIKLDNLQGTLTEKRIWDFLLACDAMVPLEERIFPATDVREAFAVAEKYNLEEIPVVDEQSEHVVGVFSVRQAKRIINERYIEWQMSRGTK